MTKIKKTKGKIYKGAMFALASVMATSMLPTNALASLAAWTGPTTKASANSIVLRGDNIQKNVILGNTYTIPKAEYTADGSTYNDVTNIRVTYKNTNDEAKLSDDKKSFKPTRVGTYVIEYTYGAYTFNYEINCEVSGAYFEFDDFDYVMPSVYDLGILKDKEYYDVYLPTPAVYDENDKLVKETVKETTDSGEVEKEVDLPYYTDFVEAATKSDNFVVISVAGREGVKIDEEEGKFKIAGKATDEASSEEYGLSVWGVGNYTVTYSFYRNDSFITSTEKTFEVSDKYYTDKDGKSGYTLNTTWGTTPFTTANTGVKKELPTIKGQTSATDSPATTEIPVSYSVHIFHKEDGKYVDRTNDEDGEPLALVKEYGKLYFMPYADGDYKIQYTVEDFYGNKAKVENTTFYVDKVKDQQLPTVYVYDANGGYDEATNTYTSAKNKMLSASGNKNIVIYAIGATDNASTNIELTRVIRQPGSTRVTISDYADKNLIFSYTNAREFVASNFAIKREMLKGDDKVTDLTDDTQVQTWLRNHNYLIVTGNLKKNPITGADLVWPEGTFDKDGNPVDLPAMKAELEKQGFAYVVNGDYEFKDTTYTIVYRARDEYAIEKGDKAEISCEMIISTDSYTDSIAPVVTGPKNLQNTYLPEDVIEFSDLSANDTDSQMDKVVLYRYLNSGKAPIESGETTLEFDYSKTNDFTKPNGEQISVDELWDGTATSKWYKLDLEKGKTKYTIDLANKVDGAQYVQLYIYAVDDFGNVGSWTKTMRIAQTNDEAAPVLYKVEKPTNVLEQGNEIILPTLYYADDYADYMSSQVYVYHVSSEGEKKLVTSYNMSPEANAYNQTFILKAGAFRASYAGKYEVVVVAKDSANHQIATYFDYTVTGESYVEDIEIDNITSETITLRVGEKQYLTEPTLSISGSSQYGYVGIDSDDDANTASYYTVNAVSSETPNFQLETHYFSATSKGKYEIQYNVFLVRYEKSELEAGGHLELVDGRLYFKDGGNKYLVFVDKTVDTDGNESYELRVNTNSWADKSSDVAESKYSSYLKFETRQSKVQTINVTDTDKPIPHINFDKIKASYENTGSWIVVPRIEASTLNAQGLHPTKSYVTITVQKPTGTDTLAKIEMGNWESSSLFVKADTADADLKDGQTKGELNLHLEENGTYTIKYHLEDYSGNYDESAVKTISNGDVVKPTITPQTGYLKNQDGKVMKKDEYKVGDSIVIDLSKIDLVDKGGSDRDYLLSKLKITCENTDINETVSNSGNENEMTWNFKIKAAGKYKITITTEDEHKWTATYTENITVSGANNDSVPVYKTIGTILIVISCVLLVGIVAYFVVSKVKQDKKKKLKR